MIKPTVIIASTQERSESAESENLLLLAALTERGADARVEPWDAAEEVAGWSAADLVTVRTTWDYTWRRDEFLSWAKSTDAVTMLQNPLAVMEWNSHKRYLVELARAGVPVVPTTLIPAGGPYELLGPDPLVMKPAVAAGGRGAYLGPGSDLNGTLADLLSKGDVLIQPVVESIATEGEISLIKIGNKWSHAVRKIPAAGGFLVQESHGGRMEDYEATARELEIAESALGCSPAPVHAARVDLVRFNGEPVVMELELIEPDLFLRRSPQEAGRLADALLEKL
ncbi:RimK family alpha-L-glutamate ligase [Streptomyces hygroscopicus]|uniref:ATP-grasp domain-containing protein n=1 Tax=Streptomyces hygroscopicus TaxID=1912 RepID=UPI0036B67AF5